MNKIIASKKGANYATTDGMQYLPKNKYYTIVCSPNGSGGKEYTIATHDEPIIPLNLLHDPLTAQGKLGLSKSYHTNLLHEVKGWQHFPYPATTHLPENGFIDCLYNYSWSAECNSTYDESELFTPVQWIHDTDVLGMHVWSVYAAQSSLGKPIGCKPYEGTNPFTTIGQLLGNWPVGWGATFKCSWGYLTYTPKAKSKPKPKTLHELFNDNIFATKPVTAYRTQKARGLAELRKAEQCGQLPFSVTVPEFTVIQHESEVGPRWTSAQAEFSKHDSQVFARPCPTKPEHGFIDSRVVTSVDECRAVWRETIAADPNGELLLMPAIQQTVPDKAVSMVWANGGLSLGAGHDGATDGKNSYMFWTTDTPPIKHKAIHNEADYKLESPFFEFVWGSLGTSKHQLCHTVQMRSGPTMDKVLDLIQEARCNEDGYLIVKEVVKAKGTLTEWKQTCAALEGREGIVVDHAGGTPASHWFVHCKSVEIPIVTTHTPQVGDNLSCTLQEGDIQAEALLEGVYLALRTPVTYEEAAKGMIAVARNWGDVAHTYDSALSMRYLGAGVGFCLRLGSLAALGESRHADTAFTRPIRYDKHDGSIRTRDAVYSLYWNRYDLMHRRLAESITLFKHHPFTKGYGGAAWAECTTAIANLHNQISIIVKLLRAKVEGKDPVLKEIVGAILGQFNETIDLAHNNGWWFNKFIEQAVFDASASNPALAAVDAAPLLYHVASTPMSTKCRAWHEKKIQTPKLRQWVDVAGVAHNASSDTPELLPVGWVLQVTVRGSGTKKEHLHYQLGPINSKGKPHVFQEGHTRYSTFDVTNAKKVNLVKAAMKPYSTWNTWNARPSLAGTDTEYMLLYDHYLTHFAYPDSPESHKAWLVHFEYFMKVGLVHWITHVDLTDNRLRVMKPDAKGEKPPDEYFTSLSDLTHGQIPNWFSHWKGDK